MNSVGLRVKHESVRSMQVNEQPSMLGCVRFAGGYILPTWGADMVKMKASCFSKQLIDKYIPIPR